MSSCEKQRILVRSTTKDKIKRKTYIQLCMRKGPQWFERKTQAIEVFFCALSKNSGLYLFIGKKCNQIKKIKKN